jgi:hypothetical protein
MPADTKEFVSAQKRGEQSSFFENALGDDLEMLGIGMSLTEMPQCTIPSPKMPGWMFMNCVFGNWKKRREGICWLCDVDAFYRDRDLWALERAEQGKKNVWRTILRKSKAKSYKSVYGDII